jgi:NAD(P)H dehydrogenase (quinone)
MTRIALVHCHPIEGSFTAAARDTVSRVLTGRGATVDVIDLYAERFDPVRPDPAHVTRHRDLLAEADALVLVYPTWWSAQPAMLQGWVEHVVPRAALRSRPMPGVRRILAVTSHGSPKWLNALEGEAGKRLVTRYLRRAAHRRCRTDWIALYGMDRIGDAERTAHLERAAEAAARIAGRDTRSISR